MLVEHIQTGKRYEAVSKTRRVAFYETIIWHVNEQTLTPDEFWKEYRQIVKMEPQA